MRSTQGNEILIKPRVLTRESVPSVCLRDNNGSHKETWEGRTGKRAGIVIHSLVSRLLAPVVYFPTASLICCIYFFIFFYPSTTKRHLSASERSTKSRASFFKKCKWRLFAARSCHRVDEGIVGSLVCLFLFFFLSLSFCAQLLASVHQPDAESVSGAADCRCAPRSDCAFPALFPRAICQH